MKKRILCVLLLSSFLTNTLTAVFNMKPLFAEGYKTMLTSENFSEDLNDAPLPSIKGFENQQSALENFNRQGFGANEWGVLSDVEGNKTRLIVGIDNEKPGSFAEIKALVVRHRATIVSTVSIRGAPIAVVVELSITSVSDFIEDLRTNELASYVEPNMKVQAQLVPNDPYWSLQWGPQKIEADWAWNTTVGNSSILVAVVDTGIAYSHPDIIANYVPLGYDWVNMDSNPWDDHGHGTHCAGIIAAAQNNGVGIAGLAQVHVMAEKVLNADGQGYSDWVAEGIIHATDMGAKIISMSFGGYEDSEVMHEAINYAYNAGVLLVAAAGNEGTNVRLYPAAYDEVIAVAATDQYDNPAWFSNWGDWIELAAPGVDILSTVPWGYESWSGTSMATPHVSGVAALAWSHFSDRKRDWIRLWLQRTADDLGKVGFDIDYGYGRINARRAIEMAAQTRDLIVYEWETPPYVKPNSTAVVNATVLNFGFNNEANIPIQLLANSTLIASETILFLNSGSTTAISLIWSPTVEGTYNLTLFIVPVDNETDLNNNFVWRYIDVGHPLKAVVLHSAGNSLSEIIANWQALNSRWRQFGKIMIYIDYISLNKASITYTDIASTEADVLIISGAYNKSAGWQFTDSEIEAIRQYVYEGHGLIATAGTFNYDVPNNNKLAPLFGLSETTIWDSAPTNLLNLLDITHPLLHNIPNPYVFPSVGTTVPIDRKWDSNELAGGEYLAIGELNESAIVFHRNLVYISPWLETIPPYYDVHLQLLYNAITLTQYKKPQHELVVSLDATKYLQKGQSSILHATVYNMGLSNETNIQLYLTIDGYPVNSTIFAELLAGESRTLSYLWKPTSEKAYNITSYSPPLSDEEIMDNNVDFTIVYVRSTMFVLWDYTKDTDCDSLTRKYKRLYLLLKDNGFIIETLNEGPIDYAILANYDIFVLMDPEIDFLPSEISAIQTWVATGGGLIILPDGGYSPTINTLLAPYGVQVTGRAGGYGVTTNFINHPITQGVSHIWINLAQEIKVTSPSATIAWTPEFLPFLATTDNGEVVVLSESNIMDNEGLVEYDNIQLTLNIFNWVGSKPQHDLSVWLDTPKLLGVGDVSMLNATVRNKGLNNETDLELCLLINGTQMSSTSISQLQIGKSYTLSYLWAPTIDGVYNITCYVSPVPEETIVANNILTKQVFVSHTGGTYIFIDPPKSTQSIGKTFAITIKIGYAYNLFAWQIKLYYNFTQLQFVNATYPPGHIFDGTQFVPVVPYNGSDENGAFILYYAGLIGTPIGFSGSGTLCQITFRAIKTGTSSLLFSRPLGWEGDTWLIDPYINDIPFSAFEGAVEVTETHDVALISIKPSVDQAYKNWVIQINVTAQNKGDLSENFTIAVYYDNTTIAQQTIFNLLPNENITCTFDWNLSSLSLYVNYTIWAEASLVPNDVNATNNKLFDGTIVVKKIGDINCDGDIDGLDLAIICKAFASKPTKLRWNVNADLNQDGKIDGLDIIICAKNYPN